ncbi:hypothetical protein EHS25_003211 [Saitozyma podzolica]|uniref:Serine aminopeptidase S33 domain-containing protein n=1 Tax=Saitozyma podzolica TaxID=1890683 RepID=A0A427Y866_9TREE|nr:hypothetical protein EHS25_003211 [Saitozyma podzolica]
MAALDVTVTDEWVLGSGNTPFFTKRWYPSNEEPKAYIVFMHGFSEHAARYDHFFRHLAAAPSSLHIFAFDQRGYGRTGHEPSDRTLPRTVKHEKSPKRKSGGWAKALPDAEFFVRREHDRAKGKKVFLWGHSMGGGQALAFATRPHPPPSKDTLALLSGVIGGGACIRLTSPKPWVMVKAGGLAASMGLGHMLIPAPIDYDGLSHNKEANDACRVDPFCEQIGSLRGLGDLINGGGTLDSPAAWDAWPKDLPLLMYHGGDDPVTDPKVAERFYQNVKAEDKKFELLKGMLHEVHNELEPTPQDLAKLISDWVHAHIGDTPSNPDSDPATNGSSPVAKL